MADEQQIQNQTVLTAQADNGQQETVIIQDIGSPMGDMPGGTSLMDQLESPPAGMVETRVDDRDEEEIDGIANNHNFRLILAIIIMIISAFILWLILR